MAREAAYTCLRRLAWSTVVAPCSGVMGVIQASRPDATLQLGRCSGEPLWHASTPEWELGQEILGEGRPRLTFFSVTARPNQSETRICMDWPRVARAQGSRKATTSPLAQRAVLRHQPPPVVLRQGPSRESRLHHEPPGHFSITTGVTQGHCPPTSLPNSLIMESRLPVSDPKRHSRLLYGCCI